MNLTLSQVVSMEIIMRPLIPYVLPSLVCLPLVVYLSRHLPDVQEVNRKAKLRIIFIIVASYFLLNLPYAITLLVEYPLLLNRSPSTNYGSLCNFKWFFFLVHQSWYLLTPLLLILLDPVLDTSSISQFLSKFKKMYDD